MSDMDQGGLWGREETLEDLEAASETSDREVPARGSTPSPSRIAPKEYYSMGEVCDLVDLKPHVLRYWESQFPVLNPSKNRSGNRVFQRKEIKLILLVKHLLYSEKYTIEGARQKLDQLRRGGELRSSADAALGPELASTLRQELADLLRTLSAPLPSSPKPDA